MCFGGSSKTKTPPPSQPTTFDYNAANRAQLAADMAAQQRQAAVVNSTTTQPGTFGSELGATQTGAN